MTPAVPRGHRSGLTSTRGRTRLCTARHRPSAPPDPLAAGEARILVADAHPSVRAWLVAAIRSAPDLRVAAEAADCDAAVAQAARTKPDLLLMDLHLPGLDGPSAVDHLLSAPYAPRVVFLAATEDDARIAAMLRGRASGVLLKDAGPRRLLSALHCIAAGDHVYEPAFTRHLVGSSTGDRTAAQPPPPELDVLTPRERQVIERVGKGGSNADIARRMHLSEATVKTHLNRAMAKLELSSRAQVVTFAYETGLVTPATDRSA
ncbi:response regulator transcription factor [Actinomadura sp. KC06]|uniref:LuxR C-terminal-related transcriptional regulator n=1 Tax=Actinomadura sp. KC06 TaxID=2530369 RepID=UPI001046682A|nr:response regulator transcription factor [Actinomadura sp. KC06]TDD36585.1 response regulator transcription factor [Actinomadura sp. KC06]